MFFDDEERSTICPHPTLWPEFPSWVELLMYCVAMAVEVAPILEELDRLAEDPHRRIKV